MSPARFGQLVSWGVLLVVVFLGPPAMGEPAASEKKTALVVEKGAKATVNVAVAPAASEKEETSRRKRSNHQLPPYYAAVVDEQQRAKIYQIQDEYAPKLSLLKAQLETLTAERNEKVAAVLTEEQRAKVETLKAEAKRKRAAKGNGAVEAQATSRATAK